MKRTAKRVKAKASSGNSGELRIAGISASPGTDVRMRLHKLFSLLVTYANRETSLKPATDASPPNTAQGKI